MWLPRWVLSGCRGSAGILLDCTETYRLSQHHAHFRGYTRCVCVVDGDLHGSTLDGTSCQFIIASPMAPSLVDDAAQQPWRLDTRRRCSILGTNVMVSTSGVENDGRRPPRCNAPGEATPFLSSEPTGDGRPPRTTPSKHRRSVSKNRRCQQLVTGMLHINSIESSGVRCHTAGYSRTTSIHVAILISARLHRYL